MHKVSRILTVILVVMGLCASMWGAWAADKSEDVEKGTTFMRAKLGHTQKVLEGLLTADFEMILTNAQKMSLLTRALDWEMLEGAEYTQRSVEFRRSVNQLAAEAKQKNLDGVALAYLDITIQCVQCHQYIRQIGDAQPKSPKR